MRIQIEKNNWDLRNSQEKFLHILYIYFFMFFSCFRHLLICFLWVLKNVDKPILKQWWIELPHNRLQTLLEVLRITLSCFQYKVTWITDVLWCDSSMTSLFAHKVAQPTKWRFLPKNLSQLVIFVIGLAFTWVWGDKNRAQF